MTNHPTKPCYRCRIGLSKDGSGLCLGCKTKKNSSEPKRKQHKKDPKVKKWLNTKRYKDSRVDFLYKNQLCNTLGCNNHSKVLDHITPHCGDKDLFWDKSNWQPKCIKCHNRKTAQQDGGFGNPIK